MAQDLSVTAGSTIVKAAQFLPLAKAGGVAGKAIIGTAENELGRTLEVSADETAETTADQSASGAPALIRQPGLFNDLQIEVNSSERLARSVPESVAERAYHANWTDTVDGVSRTVDVTVKTDSLGRTSELTGVLHDGASNYH